MNTYKYWLLKNLNLIEDVKDNIIHFTKIKIIRPPSVEVFDTHVDINITTVLGFYLGTYISDNVTYKIQKYGSNQKHTKTAFNVQDGKIKSISFQYGLNGNFINVYCDYFNKVTLYTQHNMIHHRGISSIYTSSISKDGLYFIIDENVMFVVE